MSWTRRYSENKSASVTTPTRQPFLSKTGILSPTKVLAFCRAADIESVSDIVRGCLSTKKN